jgi:hypothetical protein
MEGSSASPQLSQMVSTVAGDAKSDNEPMCTPAVRCPKLVSKWSRFESCNILGNEMRTASTRVDSGWSEA